jgi:hypothetical protein
MTLRMKIATVLGALALATVPAVAVANQPTEPGNGHGKGAHSAPVTPGSNANPPEKAKAHGVHCKGLSKKHVKGEKGTPFSRCVTAAAKAQHEQREQES